MKTMMFCAAVGALFAVSAVSSSCHAATLPADYCETFSESWYQEAVALGSETPDGVYEQAEADCDVQVWGLELQADMFGKATPADHQQDMRDAHAFSVLCPNAEPGTETCPAYDAYLRANGDPRIHSGAR